MPKGKPYRRRYYRRAYRKRKGPTVTVQTSQYPKQRSTGGGLLGLYRNIQSHHPMRYASTAAKALGIAKTVAGMVNAEKKYFDSDLTSTTIQGAAASPLVILPYDGIALGDGPSDRDGVQIRVKSLLFKALLTRNASATVSRVKWAIVLDNRVQVGSTPAWTDLFDDTSISVTFTNIEDHWKRFKIIRTGTQILTSDNLEQQLDIYVPMSMPVRYDNSTNVIYGRMFIIMASDEAVNFPSINYRYRVRFYDN